jgi:hypothetical protein
MHTCPKIPRFPSIKIDTAQCLFVEPTIISEQYPIACIGSQIATTVIHIVPDDNFDDWVVRAESGREIGHFPTRETAELLARQIASDNNVELVIHLPDGRVLRGSSAKGCLASRDENAKAGSGT